MTQAYTARLLRIRLYFVERAYRNRLRKQYGHDLVYPVRSRSNEKWLDFPDVRKL